jgi:hypothetical protein
MANTENVWGQVSRIWSDDLCPSNEALANAEILLRRLKPLGLLPKKAQRGYWPTVVLLWGDEPIDIEVFSASYELNVYPPIAAGPLFDVHEFDSASEQNLLELVKRLSDILPKDG